MSITRSLARLVTNLDNLPALDLPILVCFEYANNVSAIDLDNEGTVPGHVDILCLRKGKVGGFFVILRSQCCSEK